VCEASADARNVARVGAASPFVHYDVFCVDDQRAVAKQKKLPILFSGEVQVPTTTFQRVVVSESDLRLFKQVNASSDKLFGMLWHGEQNNEGVGSLCRLTSVVTTSAEPEQMLVQVAVVGRVVIDEFLNISPYANALVTPIADGMRRRGELSKAERELWKCFEKFVTVAGKLYEDCMNSWECYVSETDDADDAAGGCVESTSDPRRRLLQWSPNRKRDIPEEARRENFSFAAATALQLPNDQLQKLLACTCTVQRMKIVEGSLTNCTQHMAARFSIQSAFES